MADRRARKSFLGAGGGVEVKGRRKGGSERMGRGRLGSWRNCVEEELPPARRRRRAQTRMAGGRNNGARFKPSVKESAMLQRKPLKLQYTELESSVSEG